MAILSAARRSTSLSLLHRLSRHLSTAPNAISGGSHAFDPAIRRLVRLQDLAGIQSLLEPLKSPPHPQTEAHLSSILTSYASAGMLDQALQTLAQIPNPTALSLNALLSACNHHPKLFRRVPDLFTGLSKKHSISPDKVSYGVLVKSHCKSGDASRCFKIVEEMQAKNVEVTNVVYTTILDSLYKEKKVQQAERLWKEMKEKGVALDAAAYNVRAMNKASSGGKPEGVIKVVEEMERAGLKPDVITYNYLILSYCNGGKLKEARKVYEGLEEKGCVPNYFTYKCYMMALCKSGDLDGALGVFNDALKQKKVPDLGAVRMLVEKLVKGKRMRVAKRVVTGLRKKFSEDFVGGWLELEKVVGLDKDGDEGEEQALAA